MSSIEQAGRQMTPEERIAEAMANVGRISGNLADAAQALHATRSELVARQNTYDACFSEFEEALRFYRMLLTDDLALVPNTLPQAEPRRYDPR